MTEPRFALWVYRMFLRLYPAQFRHDYEREVMSTFRANGDGGGAA